MHLTYLLRVIITVAILRATLISAARRQRVLIYSKCTEYCHDSISTSHSVLRKLGRNRSRPFDVITDVPSGSRKGFEDREWLFQFDAIAFVSANKDILTKKGISNLQEYIEAGGGFLGVHGSSDALTATSWYGRLLGSYFWYHPAITHATMKVHTKHPSVNFLTSGEWKVFDEIYNFKTDPRKSGHTVVLTADETSYSDPNVPLVERQKKQGKPHPIAWYKEGNLMTSASHGSKGGSGRSFYTALGHTKTMWHTKRFQAHIMGALDWVLDSPSLRSSKAPGQRNGQ